MHLMEMFQRRREPAAGLFMALTRRCPLLCDHCSTNSSLMSEEHPERLFTNLARTFTLGSHPEYLLLTGGEPLLRTGLVRELITLAHAVGTKVYLLSGVYYARRPEIPAAIEDAIAAVDHFAVSLDVFHERQVPRQATLAVLRSALERGQDVSIQTVGRGADDPYLADVTAHVRREFGDRVPMLVGYLGASGRIQPRSLPPDHPADVSLLMEAEEPSPCDMATWPVVTFNGTIAGCCNQQVVDGPVPQHLALGVGATTPWSDVAERVRHAAMLRALRLYGPQYLARRFGGDGTLRPGYCDSCLRLSDDPHLRARVEEAMSPPRLHVLEQQVAKVRRDEPLRGAIPEYAHLMTLDYQPAPVEVLR